MAKSVVLAYSGGLDTSVAVRWLQEELGVEVIAVAVDVGQGGDFDVRPPVGPWPPARSRPSSSTPGPRWPRTSRARPSPPTPCTRASTRSSRRLSRPVIVRHLVAEARRHGADAVAHGCTGKGNDQVRFEVGTRALGARPRDPGPGADLGDDPRGLRRVRGGAARSPSRRPRRSSTRSTRTSGAGPSSAARSRTPGRRRRPTSSR